MIGVSSSLPRVFLGVFLGLSLVFLWVVLGLSLVFTPKEIPNDKPMTVQGKVAAKSLHPAVTNSKYAVIVLLCQPSKLKVHILLKSNPACILSKKCTNDILQNAHAKFEKCTCKIQKMQKCKNAKMQKCKTAKFKKCTCKI
jgi:hypothetical protein